MQTPENTVLSGAGLLSVAVTVLGPWVGQYALILVCAGLGGSWAVSRAETATRLAAALLLARLMGTAVVVTGTTAWWIETRYQIPAKETLAVIAFAIGFGGDNWHSVFSWLLGKVFKGPIRPKK
jgi:uncharacterized SAM-binding protein YcdF (DUF218 family)